ncbi:MAG TPA: polyphosphate kinase 1 [Gemmatimonadales bacterium]|nr:polyphosphate kinase 1 [Gemmatimonadales bacterium]
MAAEAQFRCDVGGQEMLAALRAAPLPLRLKAGEPVRTFHRDIYLDTVDRALLGRGISVRLRIGADDRRVFTLFIGGGHAVPVERYEAVVTELDARSALVGSSEPARRLRGLIDPELLRPRVEIEVERWTRIAASGWLRREPRFAFLYDACTLRQGGLTRGFEELQVRRLAEGGPRLEQIARALEKQHALRTLLAPRHVRAGDLAQAMASEAAVRMLTADTAVVLLALDEGALAFLRHEGGLALPVAAGSGEEAARHLLRRLTASGVGSLSRIGSIPPTEDRDALEIWLARKLRGRGDGAGAGLTWLPVADVLSRIGTPDFRQPETLAALAVATRANLLGASAGRTEPAPAQRPASDAGLGTPRAVAPGSRSGETAAVSRAHHVAPPRATTDLPADQFFNVELSQLAFHQRVLELAEDPGLPLAERLRFLAIVSANLDEFFQVRVGALKGAVQSGKEQRTFDGLTPGEQLAAIAARVPALILRQVHCAEECLALLPGAGIRLRRWNDLEPAERAALADHFQSELLPVLTPRAMTLSPGHPFPAIPQLVLAFAVTVRDVRTGPVHFASLTLRARLERFLPVPGTADLIPIEEVVRGNIQAFYPDREVEGAWLFRITRAADLDVNEEDAGDLLQAIEEEVQRRGGNSPVRVEIEASMPAQARDMLLRELRFEKRGATALLGVEDVYEVDGLLDLTALRDLAGRLPPDQSFPPFAARRPFPADRKLFDLMEQGELLVHHPYDDFQDTVGRFLEEAAADPDVAAIKLTLYRLGDRSPIVEALLDAAKSGKDVAVFIELKARFDEARNVKWVRRLEEAGAQVIYGLIGLKTHAKVALVVRRTPHGLRRYAHVGTGNYNPATARIYTDLGLFTADPDITADLTDLFNQLTGSSRAPGSSYRRLLVAPATMLAGFLERIEREIAHAKEGRPARIRAQLNGLEDPEIVAALYRASAAGVDVALSVRGLCVLRPGVPGVSDRIRVTSVLGRFLEHARIYHFGNGGSDEYLIGSADWRPRNLRRRVEVVAPVTSPALTARLDAVLSDLLGEPSAWSLRPDGTYLRAARPTAALPHLHDRLLR